MPRSVNVVAARRRRKKILKLAKGYWGSRSKVFTVAKNTVEKGLQYAYRDRKVKNANSVHYGFSVSTLEFVSMVCHTLLSWVKFTLKISV